MAVRINFGGQIDALAATDLEELAAKLSENGVPVERTTLSISGVKDTLTIGISVASLTASSISTLIAVVNFWKGQRTIRYRVKLDTGSGPLVLESIEAAKVEAALGTGQAASIVIEKI